MLQVKLNEKTRIAMLIPEGALSESDFKNAANTIDLFIEKHRGLQGLIVYTREFPGWTSFGALLKHLQFVKPVRCLSDPACVMGYSHCIVIFIDTLPHSAGHTNLYVPTELVDEEFLVIDQGLYYIAN